MQRLSFFSEQLDQKKEELSELYKIEQEKIEKGDDLSPGVFRIVKIYIAVKCRIQPGDKLSGRHGNKGVASIIVPEEDMPFDEFGNSVDVILNPLGVPSRMNVGQILETHLGWAAKGVGNKINAMLKIQQKEAEKVSNLRQYLDKVYNGIGGHTEDLDQLSDSEILELSNNLKTGLPIATPVFDGISQEQIKDMLELVDLPSSGQIQLFDGKTGDAFDRLTTVGYMYILKLNHLVDDKMHARSTGFI